MHLGRVITSPRCTVGRVNPSSSAFYQSKGRVDGSLDEPMAPRDTRGHLEGFRGSNIQKSREAVKRLDRLAPTLVHVDGFIWEYKYNSPLNTPGGMAGGGGGSQIQKSWEAVKRLDRLAPNVVHVCGFILGIRVLARHAL